MAIPNKPSGIGVAAAALRLLQHLTAALDVSAQVTVFPLPPPRVVHSIYLSAKP